MHKIHKLQIFFVSYFLLTVVSSHLLNPHLDWMEHVLSIYLLESHSMLLATGVLALGMTQLIVGFEYRNQKMSSIAFILAGIGVILAALFPINLVERWSLLSSVHVIGAMMQFFFFPIALISFQHKHSKLHTYTKITGWFSLALFFLIGISLAINWHIGIIQKFTMLLSTAWFFISALNPGGDLYE